MRLFLGRALFLWSLILGAGSVSAATFEPQRIGINEDMSLFGKAPVIVTFKTPLMGKVSTKELPGAMRLARENFSATLSENLKKNISVEFDYTSAVAMVVDSAQLAELERNPLVDTIYRNGRRLPHLAESVPVVFSGGRAGITGEGTTIAILDTGVDRLHANFSGRVVSEACYSGGGFSSQFPEIVRLCPGRVSVSTTVNSGMNCSTSAYEGCDHGTHVAGIAAGESGVAPKANIIAIQVFTGIRDYFQRNVCGTGRGRSCVVAFDSDILKGLERVYALRDTHNVVAANLSLGGGSYSTTCDGANSRITGIVQRLRGEGVATTISSGNAGNSASISFPACIGAAIAVGATSDFTGNVNGQSVHLDRRVSYSNLSGTLDIYAPGTLIRSSVPGGGYASFNGTSMAAPHVAGAFAAIKSRNPSLTVGEIESIMKSVGPQVSSAGITRRRLDIRKTMQTLGIWPNTTTPVLLLLLGE